MVGEWRSMLQPAAASFPASDSAACLCSSVRAMGQQQQSHHIALNPLLLMMLQEHRLLHTTVSSLPIDRLDAEEES